MPASDPGLRRVSVHSGAAVVDLALPAAIPVATLIPPIVDILKTRGADDGLAANRYRLSAPGASALDPAMSLAQHGIDDGAVLVLSQSSTPPPAPRFDDVAEAVAATLEATTQPFSHVRRRRAARLTGAVAATCLTATGGMALIRNAFGVRAARDIGTTAGIVASAGVLALLSAAIAHRAHRDPIAALALSVIATVCAAVAGFLAVPGAPGTPNVLLAATAAAVTSVLAMRTSNCGVATLTAVSGVAVIIAVTALAGVITGAPLHAVGSVSALVSLGLLGVAARMSIVLAGLSPRLPADDVDESGDNVAAKAIRADTWLSGLLAAFASSAAVGAVVTVLAGAPRLSSTAFGALTGALLLLRSRGSDRRRMLVFVIGGIAVAAITFGVAAVGSPEHGPRVAVVTLLLAAAALYLGFVAPALSLSPLARRSVELLESLALVAMVPLTCWICGAYATVRGLNVN